MSQAVPTRVLRQGVLTEYVTPCFIVHFANISFQSRFFKTQGVLFFTDTDVNQFLIRVPKLHAPKLIKKCPNRSRIVPDTEYIINLRTINLKIIILLHTFCAPPPAVQQ